MTNISLGNFSKRVLLTGAGWSHNWGGLLAAEIWQALIGHELVRDNRALHNLLLNEPSFEVALGRTHASPFTARDREELERALLDAFIAMDREICRPDHDPWIPIYKIQELLFRFWGQLNQGFDTGYLFTLNQDLFFERHLYNEHVYGAPAGSVPGIEVKPNRRWFSADIGSYCDELTAHPTTNPELRHLTGHMNVIKLHGSFNWRTDDGRNVMVVGTAKTRQIASLPLLTWYSDVFKKVLTADDVRLMIAGYSFSDEHINSVVADAIEHHGLKVFIWDTDPNLKNHVLSAPYGGIIWGGLISTATRRMTEVFPSNQAETGEYIRIKETLFV